MPDDYIPRFAMPNLDNPMGLSSDEALWSLRELADFRKTVPTLSLTEAVAAIGPRFFHSMGDAARKYRVVKSSNKFLMSKLDAAREMEDKQFTAKWNALNKADDYRDACDQLKDENRALKAELDRAWAEVTVLRAMLNTANEGNDRLAKMVNDNDKILFDITELTDKWSEGAEED